MKKILITIDGPAGAGKTTVSKLLASRLGYKYIDTGALYRGVALNAMRNGLLENDRTALEKLLDRTKLQFEFKGETLCLSLNGEDVSAYIRTPEISMLASRMSAVPLVREFLFSLQKKIGIEKAAVFEGRDMGTVVFPEADMKFFLEASIKERAKRRYLEMVDKKDQTLEEVEKQIEIRDTNDRTRAIAPLKPADDAIIIDSTMMPAVEVVHLMLTHINDRY